MEEHVYDAEYVDGDISNLPAQLMSAPLPQVSGAGMVQAHTPYVSAMQVMKPRNMKIVEESILRQAALLGEKAAYGWGARKGRVEGISVRMAMIMFNTFGNMTIVAHPVQESAEAWTFTHYIVDLETGASAPRQWRESKRSKVDGNMDPERKDAIRFGRGQSKNIRNVILNRMPHWLTQKVLEESQKGARERLKKFIDAKGIAVAQSYAVDQLKRHGVTEAQILEKTGKAKVEGLDLEDLVMLSADINAIASGEEHASVLFPASEADKKPVVDLKDKLKAATSQQPVATPEKSDGELNASEEIKVRTGVKPFTHLANDSKSEYLVTQSEDGVFTCNCKPRSTTCAHAAATQRFAAQL
jgi:hypothetical protein